jgi:hypothetical protein
MQEPTPQKGVDGVNKMRNYGRRRRKTSQKKENEEEKKSSVVFFV